MAEFVPPQALKNVAADKLVIVKGKTILALLDAIRRISPIAGEGLEESGGYSGTVLSSQGSGDDPLAAFYRIYRHPETGDIYLQGGSVNAGTGNIWVNDIPLYSASTEEWAAAAYDVLVIVVSGTGVEADGVLLPGFDAETASPAWVSPVPSNVMPTAASTDGTVRVVLGQLTETSFIPSGKGNVNITFCPGGYTILRDTQ